MSTSVTGFRSLGVIGAGNMGSGIAQKMATEGFPVVLIDVDDEKVGRGLRIIADTLAEGVGRRIFKPEQAQSIRERVRGTTDWRELADAELVVEAVFEDEAVKREVFRRLDRVCRADAILATNTSSLSVTELAAATSRPERVLGLHYFYHPAKNRLVEVIPGERTDAELVRRAWALHEQLGKTPIASADRAGFVVNRFFVPWLNEAVRLVEEGVADIPTVEAACKDTFGVGMGPFELMNVTGVPIALHAATTLGRRFGRFYEPAGLLARQAASGKAWTVAGEPDRSRFDAVSGRMLSVVFLVSAALVDERVGTLEDTDIGARVGLRWPRGPFEMMNRHGIDRAAALAGELAARWSLQVPELLAAHAAQSRPFHFRLIRSEVRDGVATLTLNRPDALNALNEALVAQLHEAFREVASSPEVRGIVLAGSGKAFVAGADVRFFVRHMESGTLDRIVGFTRAGHDLLNEIDRCPKPVVARVHGLALGGGLELALACDRIVASTRAAMAFPETGLGIYPGLGGTQRGARRVGSALTKWLVFTGQVLPAEEAAAIGLVDRAVPPEGLDQAVREALAEGPVRDRRPVEPPPSHRGLAECFARHPAESLREGRADPGVDPKVARALKAVTTKAPIALRVSEQLIDGGAGRPLPQALELELGRLVEVFSTRDAHEGLSSLGKKAPVFEGR
jgi:enoyl-CoA hydratase/3-hydroxyacyl-CoA dehydrogenase